LTIVYSTIGPSSFTFVGPAGPAFTPAANINGDVPASPTAVTTSVNGAGNVVINWTAPTNPDVLSYTVLRSSVPTSGIPSTPVAVLAPGHAYSTSGTPTALPGGGTGMLGAGAVPPATTFTDTTANPGTTYIYFVVATADAPNNGSTSAPSLPSAQITPPVSATASFAPLSTSTGFALGNTSDTAGALQAGDTFTVGFSGPVTINSAAFSLTVTDGAHTAVLTPANSTLTQGATSSSVVYTVSANSIPGTPGPIAFSAAQPLEVVAQSGVSNSVGQWNLEGSLAVNGPYAATFDAAKTVVATAAAGAATTPAVTAQAAGLGSTTVTVTGTTAGDTVTVTDQNGNVLGTAVATGASTPVTTSTTVTTATVLIAVQQTPGGYLSQGAATVGWSNVPIATTGSLAASTAVHLTASTLPLLSVAFAATGGGNGTFLVNGIAPATTQAASSTGQFAVTFTAGTTTTGSLANIITASNGATPATTNATSYTTGP
jgi:hypothetical protein